MARIEDVSWGSYQEYEGPFYKGKVKFEISNNPSINDKRLAAITAIESGRYDAINMYDRMIVSVGLIQWGEANTFSFSKMLGNICEEGLEHIVQMHLKPALEASGASFKITTKGDWRFFIGNSEVNSLMLQQKLFLSCDGRKGSWNEQSKRHAKLWAACVASVLEDPRTIEIQKRYTSKRLLGFVTSDAKKDLFEDKASSSWAEATRTIFLTYAINLPRIAGNMYKVTKFVGDKWSPEWCLCLIKKLTFGPNIKIYPGRYDALRPIIEKLYGIELPKTSKLLQQWVHIPERPVTIIQSSQEVLNNNPQSTIKIIVDSVSRQVEILDKKNEVIEQTHSQTAKFESTFFQVLINFIKKLFMY